MKILAATCMVLAHGAVLAAGGHHAVDDAVVLEPGQCQQETWVDRFGPGHGAWHLGPACRIGAWELGVNVDQVRFAGEPAFRIAGPQAKWAGTFASGWSAGVVLSPGWEAGRYKSTIAIVPVTWQATPSLLLHLNAGRELPRHGAGRTLAGVAAEWSANEQWSFVAERFNDTFGRAARVGARWQVTPSVSLDLSRARAFADARGTWWTFGVTFVADGVVR